MVGDYRTHRDLSLARARALGLTPRDPAGAFYLWLELPRVVDSQSFADRLLTRHRVAVAPGTAFGEPGGAAIRISLAADRGDIAAGLDAVGDLLEAGPR